jgi:hypothetical protein
MVILLTSINNLLIQRYKIFQISKWNIQYQFNSAHINQHPALFVVFAFIINVYIYLVGLILNTTTICGVIRLIRNIGQ